MLKIVDLRIDLLKEYENNPRYNEEAVEKVAESIKEFGFKVPIIIDKNNIIIAGHTRYKAAKEIGLKKVPCMVADDLTPEQVKAFRLADNKVSEYSSWDYDKLYIELMELKVVNFNIESFGFETTEIDTSEADVDSIYEKFENENTVNEVIEDDFDIDEAIPEIPTTTLGQIWELGNHRLMCGDSTQKNDVMRLMNGQSAHMLLTDPPYNVDYEGTAGKIQNDNMSNDNFKMFLTNAFAMAFQVLENGAAFYVWYASREHINFEGSLNKAGLEVKQQLIWRKNSMVMGRQDYQWKHEPCLYGWKEGASHNWYSDRSQTTILEFDKPSKSELHPTTKPNKLFSYQIKNSSKENDVILDLFGGSGTTLIACEQLNRKCFMMELDPKYCDVIINRWETLTGKKAIVIND